MANLEDIESRRLQLEENVTRLQRSLQHWRQWDAEYEGLKENLGGSEELKNEDDCKRISDDLGGELVTESEVKELFGAGKGLLRDNLAVIRLIGRRQDYVQQNIETTTKQLRSAEDQLGKVLEEINGGEEVTYSGLPLTEILEELDEEGNVISSKVSHPETATEQILNTLRKAGITDVGPGSKSANVQARADQAPEAQIGASPQAKAESSASKSSDMVKNANPPIAESKVSNPVQTPDAPPPPKPKKSVKFADSVDVEPVKPTNESTKQTSAQLPDSSLIKGSFRDNDRVVEIDDDDEVVGATIPEDESPEDARLRREMLQYSLNEVGSVVAELDLDEEFSDDDYEDYDLDDEDDASEFSEEEDEHGRSLRKGVTKSYRQQMAELEAKLQARMIENLGPQPDEENPEINPDELRRLVIRNDEAETKQAANDAQKKGVRFADTVDVSEAPQKVTEETKPVLPKPTAAPIAEAVIERSSRPIQSNDFDNKDTARVSKFKQARKSPPEPPSIELQRPPRPDDAPALLRTEDDSRPILSQTVLERPKTASNAPAPDQDDELDPELQQRQLAAEYYRMRNNMIRQQGGFKPTEEEVDQPLMEERDGKVKKVSRFRAARMKF